MCKAKGSVGGTVVLWHRGGITRACLFLSSVDQISSQNFKKLSFLGIKNPLNPGLMLKNPLKDIPVNQGL